MKLLIEWNPLNNLAFQTQVIAYYLTIKYFLFYFKTKSASYCNKQVDGSIVCPFRQLGKFPDGISEFFYGNELPKKNKKMIKGFINMLELDRISPT